MADASWRRDRETVLVRFVEACSADDRIVAAFLAGSAARGVADERSDLDLCAVVPDDAFDDVAADRGQLLAQLGEVLFLEDFGSEALVFAILADGSDIELHLVRESQLDRIRPGPHRVLLDRKGVLADVTFPWPGHDQDEHARELHRVVTWFWHDLSHFAAAIDRGQLWWGAGQLEQLRGYCVRLARVEHRAEPMPDEPYWKLDAEMSTEPLEPIRSTFVPLERDALLDAARTLLAFFRSRAPRVAEANGVTYPAALDRLVGGRLDGPVHDGGRVQPRRVASMPLRIATEHDVSAICDVFMASYNDLHRHHGLPEQDPEDRSWLEDALRHLLDTDPSGTVVAVDDEAIAGFAASYLRDSYWFLSFLFVCPDRQGRGVGRALLDSVMPPHRDGLTRALVVESFQPISTGLYARHGITPRAVRYVLSDLRDLGQVSELPEGLQPAEASPASITEMTALDLGHLGTSRAADHEWWLRSGMEGRVYRTDGAAVGYAYVEDGIVGPVLAGDERTLCAIVADLLRTRDRPEALKVPLHGNNAALFRMLTRAGARIEADGYQYLYCSTDEALPSGYLHYAGYMP